MAHTVNFKKLSFEDCNQLHQWLQLPHVREFWDDGNRTVEQVHSYYYRNNGVARFLFLIDGEPAGYIQSYFVDDAHPYKKFILAKKTNGVDFFIGNKKFLGIGLAQSILEQFIRDFCHDANSIVVDPNSKNEKAIHIYKKCGFSTVGKYNLSDKLNEIMMLIKTARSIVKNNFYIITGGPGSGKTTLLNELKARGFPCVEEVARQIIQDQTEIGGDALHTKNKIKFRDLMLFQSIATYEQVTEDNLPVFFDRGIPELVGYCRLIKTDIPDFLLTAVKSFRYNQKVFIAPPWKDIYQNDKERKQSWEEAIETYCKIADSYLESGYQLIEIPKTTSIERADFILGHLLHQT